MHRDRAFDTGANRDSRAALLHEVIHDVVKAVDLIRTNVAETPFSPWKLGDKGDNRNTVLNVGRNVHPRRVGSRNHPLDLALQYGIQDPLVATFEATHINCP